MAELTYLFKRVEKKYFLDLEQYGMLMERIADRLTPDKFGRSTLSNIYLDTPDFLLIRNSIDAIKYKEKLRLRSYGTPKADDRVFLEIKKKFKGVVYKRRVSLSCGAAEEYLHSGVPPFDTQIMREIDWSMHYYGMPQPAVVLSYEREAFFLKEDKNVRLTFDRGVRYRTDGLSLTQGDGGKEIIPSDKVLMEVKTPGAMPIWLSRELNGCLIYPSSFSKYGRAYADIMQSAAK